MFNAAKPVSGHTCETVMTNGHCCAFACSHDANVYKHLNHSMPLDAATRIDAGCRSRAAVQ